MSITIALGNVLRFLPRMCKRFRILLKDISVPDGAVRDFCDEVDGASSPSAIFWSFMGITCISVSTVRFT